LPPGGSAPSRAAVPTHPLDRQPLQGRPAVGRVPLLTGGDQGRHEPAGPQELAPEARGDPTALLGRGQSEIERGSGRERRAVVYALAALPADVVEEPGDGVVGEREQRL